MHKPDFELNSPCRGEYRNSEADGFAHTPIAIVGIGCRFPGGIRNADSFWRLLQDGGDAITEIPPDRIDIAAYYDARPDLAAKMSSRRGGFLEHIDKFDAAFFGVSPHEAERMDPQQRALLEVAWEALEDAGQPVDRLAGSITGVFIGLWLNDYESRLFADPASVDFYACTGTGRYSASGRLSYALGLEGPSLTIDTACSSSLVAVHLACQSLRRNECSLALAGGANVILQPHISIAYSQSKMIAPDGRCKFGDAQANGYVRSEGAGVVVLKALPNALRDGDPIYAVILGSAVNNDGRSSGYLTTPSCEGQERMLHLAYGDAGISPSQVRYIEAHGTGTAAGDPVEINALGNVLSSNRPSGSVCYVGSVKTNFGHTEGAAGIAGLIKTALVLKHRTIPANLHLRELNPGIPWKEYSLVIPREAMRLVKDSEPFIAGVSAFGITGTNAHAVLSEAPCRGCAEEEERLGPKPPCVLPLSARSPEALAALASAYVSTLNQECADSLYDICATAALRRTHHEHRLIAVARDHAGMRDTLQAFLRGDSSSGVWTGKAEPASNPKTVFVCSGQGSQWIGMGRRLIREEPVFHEWLQRCESALRCYVDWSLDEQLHLDPDAPAYRLNEVDVIQPSLFAIQIALAALWRSWGVEPDAIVGHSMGEAGAAFLAGALSLEDAARVICMRSLLLRRLRGKGTMAVVGLAMPEALKELADFEDLVSVAASNSPQSTVLSGDPVALERILGKLQARNIFCRPVKVDVASHSPQVEVLTTDLLRDLNVIQACRPRVPMYSTVTAQPIGAALLDAHYWARNLRYPVLFSQSVQKLAAEGHTVFIELSPHPVLTASIEEAAHDAGRKICSVPSLEREKDELVTLRSSAARLYTIGYPIDWARLFPFTASIVPLPAYPWQRQRFWLEAQPRQTENGSLSMREQHTLLGVRLPEVASRPGSIVWHKETAAGPTPPRTTFVEMAEAAAAAAFGPNLHYISNLKVYPGPLLSSGDRSETQFILDVAAAGVASFQVFCRASEPHAEWTRCASGEIESSDAKAEWIYDLVWKRKPLERNTPEIRAGRWLIFADRAGISAAVAAEMKSRGQECVQVFAGASLETEGSVRFSVAPESPDHIRRVLSEITEDGRQSCQGIIYLCGFDSHAAGCDGALHLIQALHRTKWATAAPRLWLVTTGAQAVEPSDGISLALEQAPLWGLGRVVALEYPGLWGGLIDLSTGGTGAAALCDELLTSDGEDQVALRGESRYVLRLERSRPTAIGKPLTVLPDATYLITGGLGNLGLQLAHWLVARGARHIVLTGRTGLPERHTWRAISPETEIGSRIAAIGALEGSGATVHIVKADVAVRRDMTELWNELEAHHPPVRGIIHAAGVLRPCDIAKLERYEFQDVLRSKVNGGALLHEFTQSGNVAAALDFFVLFSSAAAVWGSKGLAHYAAANHYLDALAQHRAALGLPALSVNWGWWDGNGLVSEELAALFRTVGLKGLPASGGLAALRYLLETGAIQKTVADVDWGAFRPIFEARRRRPLLEALASPRRANVAGASEAGNEADSQGQQNEKRHALLKEIERAPAIDQKSILEGHIRAQVAEILGFRSPENVDPRQGFFRMGMDSLMTMQLRSRLEASLWCSLPPTLAFEYPTIESLAAFIAGTILKLAPPVGNGMCVIREQPVENFEPESQLASEEELVALLARKLDQIG